VRGRTPTAVGARRRVRASDCDCDDHLANGVDVQTVVDAHEHATDG